MPGLGALTFWFAYRVIIQGRRGFFNPVESLLLNSRTTRATGATFLPSVQRKIHNLPEFNPSECAATLSSKQSVGRLGRARTCLLPANDPRPGARQAPLAGLRHGF